MQIKIYKNKGAGALYNAILKTRQTHTHTYIYSNSIVCMILGALFKYDLLNSFYKIFHIYYFRCIISYVLFHIDSDIVNIDYTTDTKDVDQKEDIDDKHGEDHVVRNHIYIYRYITYHFLSLEWYSLSNSNCFSRVGSTWFKICKHIVFSLLQCKIINNTASNDLCTCVY